MSRGPVLAVPALEPGRGGGHLIRCMALVRELRERGRDARLFLTEGVDVSGIFNTLRFDASWLTAEAELPLIAWDFIVLDRFQTPPEEFERWAGLAPLAGIDEGGPCRDRFDFLIDLLPGLPNRSKPNVADPSLLPLPAEPPRRLPGGGIDAPLKILVSFGHEDAAGLGPAAAKALAAKNNNGVLDITLLRGGLQRNPPLGVCGALAQMIKKMHDFVHFLPFRLLKEPENRGFLRSKAAKIHKSHRLLAACALPGLRALETIPDLGKRLADYDLVITHYGLTAFEAVYAGTPVLLVSPGAYHEKLARAAGFLSAGTGTRGALAIPRLLFKKHRPDRAFLQSLETRRAALAARHSLDRKPEQSLAGLLAGFSPPAGKTCPVCGDAACGAVFGRGPERGFRRCKRCGVIFMRRFNPPSLEYGRDYFFELYQKQYGKTYIEDFPNLTAMAKRRLARIRSLLPSGIGGQGVCGALAQMIKKMHNFVHFLPCRLPKEPKNRGFLRSKAAKTHKSHRLQGLLLDIGCAYGPFLVAAREEGFSPAGIDPAEDAVRYVTQTLGIPAVQGFFPGCRLPECNGASGGGRLFDAVTLWYVIEHFQNCVPVLAEIRRILKPGGVLSFSSPSFTGISGRSSLKRFLAQSPADHWTIWSPAMCKKALARAGFKVMKIVISGHHPDRFPLLGRFAHKKGPLSVFLTAASKLFALGDTFEVYALAGRLSAAGPRGEPLGEPQGPVWGVAEDPKGPERRGGGQKRRRCADHVWKQPPL